LIAGGHNSVVLKTAELYDPIAGTFTLTAGSMAAARMGATATVLLSGKVLIAGGSSDGTVPGALQTADLYDPVAGTFAVAGSGSSNMMTAARFNQSATLLPSGMVLLVGGANGSSTELYDPDSDKFAGTASLLNADQPSLTVTLLNKDNVLITGLTSSEVPGADAEVYTPSFDPLGTVGLSSSETSPMPDVFTPASSCVLTIAGGGISTCNVVVTPAEVGTSPHTITGTYPADSAHSGNIGSNSLTVISQP